MILRDLGARAVQATTTKLGDLAALRRARARAAQHCREGRADEAVLEYGRLIRDVQHARESLRTYDRIGGWLEHAVAKPDAIPGIRPACLQPGLPVLLTLSGATRISSTSASRSKATSISQRARAVIWCR